MKNSSLKDQVLSIMIVLLVLIFLIWWIGIKPANTKYEELVASRDVLKQRELECDLLKEQNNDTAKKISLVEDDIVAVEHSFLPKLDNHSMMQYLLQLFESKGCPYLSNTHVETIDCDKVILPDGSNAADTLLCNRVTLEYAATDGYCVPQYNSQPNVAMYENIDYEFVAASYAAMGSYEYNVGYRGFIDALHTLEELNSSCIKINKIEVKSVAGYNVLTAEVDFYAINAINRVSSASSDEAYVVWSGSSYTPVDNPIIGEPLLVTDPSNAWYNVFILSSEIESLEDRPFATYYSIGVMNTLAREQGLFMEDPEADADALIEDNKTVPLIPVPQVLYADMLEDLNNGAAGADANVEVPAEQ